MKQYKQLINHVLQNGVDKDDRTNTGTRSIFGYQTRFDLQQGFPLVTLKKTNFDAIKHELLWFVSGATNIRSLVKNNINIWTDWPYKNFCKFVQSLPKNYVPRNYLNEDGTVLTQKQFVEQIVNDQDFATSFGNCGPIYGKQWRAWECASGSSSIVKTYDQLEQVVKTLKNNPDSRRMVVSAWRPDQIEDMVLPPCHTLFQFYTRKMSQSEREHIAEEKECATAAIPERKVDLQIYQRSCDLMLGVPFNIASYALLLEIVAQLVDMEPGELVWTGGDVHIYHNHIEPAEQIVQHEPYSLSRVQLNPSRTSLESFTAEDIVLRDYEHHPFRKLPVAV